MHLLRSVFSRTAVSMLLLGCDPDPTAVDECRQIEEARCEASLPCGTIDDVKACKLFYRDHCLHGIAPSVAPDPEDQEACLEAIRTAGECASGDPETAVRDCSGAGRPLPGESFDNVCDVVARPWDLVQCDFLNTSPPEGSAGAGAQ